MGKFYGRLPKKVDDRTPKLAKYMAATPSQLQIPPAISWFQAIAANGWPMYGNDRCGDCTAADAGHMIQCFSANAGAGVTPSEQDILATYSATTGYDPATGANDNGCAETDLLNYWQTTGIAGNRIDCWAAVDHENLDHLRLGCWIFGGVYLGLDLTHAAEQQFDANQPWQTSWFGSWIVGAHAVPLVGYDANYMYVVTWGKVQAMTYDYWAHHGDESYVVVDPVFLKASGISPVGLNLDQMRSELAVVK